MLKRSDVHILIMWLIIQFNYNMIQTNHKVYMYVYILTLTFDDCSDSNTWEFCFVNHALDLILLSRIRCEDSELFLVNSMLTMEYLKYLQLQKLMIYIPYPMKFMHYSRFLINFWMYLLCNTYYNYFSKNTWHIL